MVKSAKKNNNVYCAKIVIKTIPYYLSTLISVNCPSSAEYKPKKVSEKKRGCPRKAVVVTHSAWPHMSETACGRFAGLRGMPATTESVMGTALIIL